LFLKCENKTLSPFTVTCSVNTLFLNSEKYWSNCCQESEREREKISSNVAYHVLFSLLANIPVITSKGTMFPLNTLRMDILFNFFPHDEPANEVMRVAATLS
jgi:hypothetical protein